MKSRAAAILADAIEAAAASVPVAVEPPPPDALPLARRILQARDPSALAELDAGLVEAAKGDDALRAFLTRPLPVPPENRDPLEVACEALAAASVHVAALPPNSPRVATILGSAANLAKTVEGITNRRPREVTADEVTTRIAERRDDAVKKIIEYTNEARVKLDADRRSFGVWAGTNLGPLIAAELVRRLDAMLGEATP